LTISRRRVWFGQVRRPSRRGRRGPPVGRGRRCRRYRRSRRLRTAAAGSLVTAPIGDPHSFGNPDPDAPASLLCTVTPERYLGYFRELAQLRSGPDGMLVPAEVLQLMARYDTDPYRP